MTFQSSSSSSCHLLLLCHLWLNQKPNLLLLPLLPCATSAQASLSFLSTFGSTADHLTVPSPLPSHLCPLLRPCHRISVLGQSCNWIPLHLVLCSDHWAFLGEISDCLQLAMDFLLVLHVLIYLRYFFPCSWVLYEWVPFSPVYVHIHSCRAQRKIPRCLSVLLSALLFWNRIFHWAGSSLFG